MLLFHEYQVPLCVLAVPTGLKVEVRNTLLTRKSSWFCGLKKRAGNFCVHLAVHSHQ